MSAIVMQNVPLRSAFACAPVRLPAVTDLSLALAVEFHRIAAEGFPSKMYRCDAFQWTRRIALVGEQLWNEVDEIAINKHLYSL